MKLSTSLEAAETTAELSLRRGQYGGEVSSRVGLAGNEAIGGAGSRIISPRNCTVILLTTIIIFIWFVHSLLSLVFFLLVHILYTFTGIFRIFCITQLAPVYLIKIIIIIISIHILIIILYISKP